MRKTLSMATLGLLAAFAFTATEANEARAAEPIRWSSVSLGLGLGDPSALDLKLWTTEDSGFNLGVGLENFDDVFGIYAEYEFGLVAFWIGDDARGTFYIGLGGAIAFYDRPGDNDVQVAAIIPIGLNFRFRAPLEVFIEGRPGVALNDDTNRFGIGGQIGLRFIF